MANEAQKLVDVKEKIKTLNSELSGLLSEQKQLEDAIAKRQRELDMPVREKLIAEWVKQQPAKFDIKVNFSEYTKDYDIHAKRGDYGFEFSELFFVRKSMSDSDVKRYLDEITENLNLIDELIAQNIYDEPVEHKIFVDKLAVRGDTKTGKLYSHIYIDEPNEHEDSDFDIRLNKIDNKTVQVKVFYEVYEVYNMPKCEIKLNDTTDVIIEQSPFTLTSKQTIPFNNMVPEIKNLLDNIKKLKTQYIKPVK